MRAVCAGVVLAVLLVLPPALAVAADLPSVGILFPGPAGPAPSLQALEKGLRDLGWRPGETVLLEYRYADGKLDRLPALAKDLVELRVKAIVAVAGESVVAARHATNAIPIVSATGDGDFVAMKLVESWGRPGGNVTGMNLSSGEAARKRVELMKEALPALTRLAVLFHAGYPSSPQLLGDVEAAAKPLGVQIQPVRISTPDELDTAIASARKGGAEAVMTLQGPFFFFQRRTVAELAARHKLPLAMGEALSADAGALLQVNPDVAGCAERSASYVDRILRGANPAELPVERFGSTQVVFNLRTARDLGLSIPAGATRGARLIE
jgi:putative ABC transport system substrate-binding protein